ncbi:MAG: FAD-dependent monooxygenase, partial [Actinobacteria bacterium]|nr:FAD-dependent monooxygenase [Actinomycetota bacterium]
RVLVIGGGIGGLSAALALTRAGIAATVFERAPELGEVGTGIGIWVNGMAALRRLGVAEAVQQVSSPVEVQEFRSWRGRTLVHAPVGEMAREFGLLPPVIVRRPDLLKVLRDALDDHAVQLGAACVGFEQDDAGVTARFADGREERGAALVGADGIKSLVRARVASDSQAQYAGYQYLRALTQFDHPAFPPGKFSFVFGPGDRFGSSHAGGGTIYWWAVIMAPEGATDPAIGRKGEVLERFKGFPPEISALVESTAEEAIFRNDIRDMEPLERWGDGRVTLLGDSAHATTPNLGRGAGEAIEDAVVLAECLASNTTLSDGARVASALRSYEARRIPATAQVQKAARRIGKIASWDNALAWRAREILMKNVAGPGMQKGWRAEFASQR